MKKLEVIYLRKAQEDIDDITYYIAQDNLEAAVAFFEAVESTCAMLSTMPGIGSARDYRNPRFAGLRMFPVKRHEKYLIFYQSTEDELLVVRVLHGARDIAALFEEEKDEEENK
jgi:toxin ParE1/3/4